MTNEQRQAMYDENMGKIRELLSPAEIETYAMEEDQRQEDIRQQEAEEEYNEDIWA